MDPAGDFVCLRSFLLRACMCMHTRVCDHAVFLHEMRHAGFLTMGLVWIAVDLLKLHKIWLFHNVRPVILLLSMDFIEFESTIVTAFVRRNSSICGPAFIVI